MTTVAIVGLGYVGLPLAVAFGRHFRTIGYDLAQTKVVSYRAGVDPNRQLSGDELRTATHLEYTADPKQLSKADRIIVAVPTPVDSAHQPDFGPLRGASETVGKHMHRGAVVVFESTVYPGATEEICVPILEQCSGLQWKRDFHVGNSPASIPAMRRTRSPPSSKWWPATTQTRLRRLPSYTVPWSAPAFTARRRYGWRRRPK